MRVGRYAAACQAAVRQITFGIQLCDTFADGSAYAPTVVRLRRPLYSRLSPTQTRLAMYLWFKRPVQKEQRL